MTRCNTMFGSIFVLAAFAGCSSPPEQRPLPQRNKDACEAWVDHMIGQFSCVGDTAAIGGVAVDDAPGFAGLMLFFLPFETCAPELDGSQCGLFGEATPCSEIPTTLEGKEWSLTTADPSAMFSAMTDDVMVSIIGVGHEVTSASLFTRTTRTDQECDSSAPDVTLFFDGQSLRVNGRIPGGAEDCELNFEGEVTDCVDPPDGFTVAGDDERVLRFEGQGSYRSADGTGVLSTMFLRVTEPFIPTVDEPTPCEVPTTLLGTEWSLSDRIPLLSGFPPRSGPSLRVVGFDETIGFADLATGLASSGPGGVCFADSPGGVLEFDAEGVLIELAYDGESDTSCFVRFEGTFVDCEMIIFDPDGAPIHSIVLEGVGDFDNGTVSGPLDTLYLMIQEEQDDK